MKKFLLGLLLLAGLGSACERGKVIVLSNGRTVPYESVEIKGNDIAIIHTRGIVITIPRSMVAAIRS